MTKREFDKKYIGSVKIAVHCETKEKAEDFLRLADGFGYRWDDGSKLTSISRFDVYNSETSYSLGRSGFMFGSKSFYKREGCKIIEFELSPKDLLQDGFRVAYRNGNESFVLTRTETLHEKDGSVSSFFSNFKEDLINVLYIGFDIMKIYNREDSLIWERAEKTKKTERELEIERIESEMRKLADDLNKLKKDEILGK